MFRRPFALLLAAALTFTIALPIFAVDDALDSGAAAFDSGRGNHRQERPAHGEEKEALAERPETLDSGAGSFHLNLVSLPSDLSFVIDPFEIAGRGQLYSEPFFISNNGSAPVVVSILQARCIVSEESAIELIDHSVDPLGESRVKEMQILLRRTDGGAQQTIPLGSQPAEPLAFLLEAGQQAAFEVGGTVNSNPEKPWLADEARIRALFKVEPVLTDLVTTREEPQNGEIPAINP